MFKVTVVYFIQMDISNDISTVMIFRIVKLLKVVASFLTVYYLSTYNIIIIGMSLLIKLTNFSERVEEAVTTR